MLDNYNKPLAVIRSIVNRTSGSTSSPGISHTNLCLTQCSRPDCELTVFKPWVDGTRHSYDVVMSTAELQTVWQYVPKFTLTALFVTIGGTIGLWFGTSVVSTRGLFNTLIKIF